MVGENGVALGEGRDNYDVSHKIDAKLLLSEKKNKAQFLYCNFICFLYEPIKIHKLKFRVSDKCLAKLTESFIRWKISDLLKMLNGLIFSLKVKSAYKPSGSSGQSLTRF